jgi:tRNA threonylcarbamoyl adenosine modification protein YeaZ
MRQLAIDTSSRACSIALIEDGAVIVERHELLGRGHAERLIPWISNLPDGGRADEIIVGCGPGSFTGVRVGISAAKGLGLGWRVPVRGVGSLALVAASRDEPELLVAMEAGHGELFVQQFEGTPRDAVENPASLAPAEAVRRFPTFVVIGSGATQLVDLRGWGEAHPAEPKASAVALLPPRSIQQDVRPYYGRAADARPMQR